VSPYLPLLEDMLSIIPDRVSTFSITLVGCLYIRNHIVDIEGSSHRLCSLHNEVNKRLIKPEFDCAHLDDEYDCGCGDAPVKGPPPSKADLDPMDLEHDPSRDDITGAGLIKGGR
jgi:hypothetical protein